jgi:hypothetical protein
MTTATSITVRVPLAIRHQPGRKTVVTPMVDGVAPVTTQADPTLVKALARAFRYQWMLNEGRYASITEMAAAERIERGYLGSLLRLTLLAPDILEMILDGRTASTIGLSHLIEPIPAIWLKQRELLTPCQVSPALVPARPRLDAATSRNPTGPLSYEILARPPEGASAGVTGRSRSSPTKHGTTPADFRTSA